MPELPEVETVKNGLNKIVKNLKVVDVKIYKKQLRNKIPVSFKKNILAGSKIIEVRRKAKYLVFDLTHGCLINHLGMTGNWKLKGSDYAREKHDHVDLVLSNKKRLIYNDPRRFGVMLFSKNEEDYFASKKHGAEPLSKNYNFKYLKEKLKNKKAPIKSVLMDQAVVLGIGNIYVAETLHKCGVSPLRPSNKVNDVELKLIVKHSKLVLRQAIKAGGSTIKDFKKAGGESGYFQTKLLVYGREGQLCRKCHTPIENEKLSGRSSFWCPECQA